MPQISSFLSRRTALRVCAVCACVLLALLAPASPLSNADEAAGVQTLASGPKETPQPVTAPQAPPTAAAVSAAMASHSHTLIFLHGLGDQGFGWKQELAGLRIPGLKIVCPDAPSRPITINGGMVMPGWFDITNLDLGGSEDDDSVGIADSAQTLLGLVQKEIDSGARTYDQQLYSHCISAGNIFIGGFSQGGAVSIYTEYATSHAAIGKFGGMLLLSTFVPPVLVRSVGEKTLEGHGAVPVWWGHGAADPLVLPVFGEHSRAWIKAKTGVEPEFHEYAGMGHSACGQEMREVRQVLVAWMNKST